MVQFVFNSFPLKFQWIFILVLYLLSFHSNIFMWFIFPDHLVFDVEDEIDSAQLLMSTELLGQQAAGLGVPAEGAEQELFPCPRCKKVYRWMISLRRHIRLECGQEPKHPCLYCGRRFKHKHHLIGHVAIHMRHGHQLNPMSIINSPSSSMRKRKGK